MIGDAQEIISNSENMVRKLAIGTGLIYLSIFLIPFILVLGYLMRVIRTVDQEKKQLPEWNNFTGMFIDGLKVIGAVFAYTIPALLIILLSPRIVSAELGAILGGFAGLYMLVLQYFLIAILRNLAVENTLNPVQNFKAGFTKDYAVLVLWVGLLNILVSIASVLLLVTVIGMLAVPLLIFWFYIMVAIMAAQGYQPVKG